MAFWDFEPNVLYDVRQSTLEQFHLRTDFLGEQAGRVGAGLAELGKNLPDTLPLPYPLGGPFSPVRPKELGSDLGFISEPLRTSGFNIPGGLMGSLGRTIGTGFEHFGRPGAAIREGVASATGYSPEADPFAAMTAAMGRPSMDSVTFDEILKRAGVPEMQTPVSPLPGLPVTMLPGFVQEHLPQVSGRGAIGGALDIVTDPTNLIGWEPKALGAAGRVAPEVINKVPLDTLTQRVAETPLVHNISMDEVAARPVGRVAEELRKLTQMPGLGEPLRRIGSMITTPRLMGGKNELENITNHFQEVAGNIPNVVAANMAPVRAAAKTAGELPGVDERGMTTLLDDTPIAANTVFQESKRLFQRNQIGGDVAMAADEAHRVQQLMRQKVLGTLDRLNTKYPAIAENFKGLLDEAILPDNADFHPRYNILEDGTIKSAWKTARGGVRRGSEMARQYLLSDDKLAKEGTAELGPIDSLHRWLTEMESDIAEMDLAMYMADRAPHVTDPTAIAAAAREMVAKGIEVQDLKKGRALVTRALTGSTISPQTLETVRQVLPGTADLIKRTMSVKTEGPPTMSGIRAGLEDVRTLPNKDVLDNLIQRIDERSADVTEGLRSSRAAMVTSGVAEAAAKTVGESPLTADALAFLKKLDAGGIPMTITNNLRQIARRNGVSITADMKPEDIAAQFRRKQELWEQWRPSGPDVGVRDILGETFGVEQAQQDLASLQKLRDLAGQAQRGLTVSPKELNPFREKFGELVDPLEQSLSREARPPLATTLPGLEKVRTVENTTRLRQHAEALDDAIKVATGQLDEAAYNKKWFQAEQAGAARDLVELGTKAGMTRFRNIWVDLKTDEQFSRDYLRFLEKPDNPSGWLGKAADTLRTAITTLDLSAALIQGIPAMARYPEQFLQGTAKMLEAAVHPETTRVNWLAKPENQLTHQKLPELDNGKNELYRGAQFLEQGAHWVADRLVSAVPAGERAIRRGENLVQQGFERTEAAFDTFGLVTRDLIAQTGLEDKAVAEGSQHEVAQLLNHMTGSFGSARSAGMAPKRRAAESWIFFAPNYLKSSIALTGDVMQGNVAGQAAQQALARMAVAALVWYPAVARSMGQEPVMNPKDSRFMTVNIDGRRIGIGTTFLGVARMLARAADDPESLTHFDQKNPLVQFVRNRAGPTPSLLWDAITGEDPTGQPTTGSVGDALWLAGSKLMPMALSSFVDDLRQGRGISPVGLGAQMLGAREFPQTAEDVRNQVTEQRYPGRKYADLNPYEQVAVQTSPEVKAIPERQGPSGERQRKENQIYATYNQQVADAAQMVRDQRMTKDQFRGKMNEINFQRNLKLGELPEERQRPKRDQTANELAYEKFVEVLKKQDEFGRRDYDAIEEYVAGLPKEQQDYIDAKQDASIGRLPPEAQGLVREMRQAQKTLRPYYAVRKDAFQRRGMDYAAYQNADPAVQQDIMASNRGRLEAQLENRLKQTMRLKNPAVDKALVDWHGDRPIRYALSGLGADVEAAEIQRNLPSKSALYRQQYEDIMNQPLALPR